MNKLLFIPRIVLVVLTLCVASSPLLAQHKREATQRKAGPPARAAEPPPNFDTLIAADTYKIYFEVRAIGQVIHAPAFSDVLDPGSKLLGSAKEFNTILKWLRTHSDSLAGSRLLVAAWPSRKALPEAVVAIEFSSPEEAQKFRPELRGFITTLTGEAPSPSTGEANNSNPGRPSLQIMNAGSLVLVSEKPFSFRALAPRKAKLLTEDPNFVVARNRFAAESLFLYVDTKAIEKEEQDQRQKWQEEERKRIEEEANRTKPEPAPEAQEPTVVEAEQAAPPEVVVPTPSESATLSATAQTPSSNVQDNDSNDSQALSTLTSSLYFSLFNGQAKWPDAIAAAANFEDEAYVVRALILNGPESRVLPVPFFPHFISGPAVAPQSPTVLPGEADLFVSVSLDYPQIYDGLLKAIALNRAGSPTALNTSAISSPFAELEKKLGLKLKEDILPMFGNELALAFLPKPVDAANASSPGTGSQPKTRPPDPDPIVVIAVRDKEGLRRLIPKLIESFGLKGAAALAQTERKDDAEIVSYANVLSYAFVGDLLIFAPNADVTKRAVAAYLSGETLAANSHFRNAKRWQSPEVLAQVYVSPSLIEKYVFGTRTNDNVFAELVSRLATVEPLTYSLSNEGSGPLHELHVPRSLLTFVLANAMAGVNASSVSANEASAQSKLRTFVSAEETFKATTGDGHYGTLDELVTAGLLSNDVMNSSGYRIEAFISGDRFQITAVPVDYGKSGKTSYFVDESAVLRGGDHGGGGATISDPPIE